MSSIENDLELGWVLWGLNLLVVSQAYDSFLTLADEVAFLTQSQWKLAKLFYIICRYVTCGYLTLEMLVIDDPPEIWVFALYKVIASYWRRGDRNRLLEQLIHHNMIYLTCGLVFSFCVILTTSRLNVSYGFMIVRFLRNWQVTVHAFLVTKMYRGLWKADRRRALLESVSFSLTTFHAAPGVSTQA
ncbi:uncharacterized protein EDB93DRAFT_1337908 [Suillus bovinus]|uniref:uncharacterized protein n=1 Tax=Suillus bovinus TaxID=48563 RepID=UPI001B87EEE5|nr:uncharacterized protein EDB93DRAFT_1337908 [Suillus bovinus]KAG2145351.1 hypothetical protein EDB93DRAFT_1337908 [Suillus bovinus]